jgi:hypothetical protein
MPYPPGKICQLSSPSISAMVSHCRVSAYGADQTVPWPMGVIRFRPGLDRHTRNQLPRAYSLVTFLLQPVDIP